MASLAFIVHCHYHFSISVTRRKTHSALSGNCSTLLIAIHNGNTANIKRIEKIYKMTDPKKKVHEEIMMEMVIPLAI